MFVGPCLGLLPSGSNVEKYEEVTKEYENILEKATTSMDAAYNERLRKMDGFLCGLVEFQVCWHGADTCAARPMLRILLLSCSASFRRVRA